MGEEASLYRDLGLCKVYALENSAFNNVDKIIDHLPTSLLWWQGWLLLCQRRCRPSNGHEDFGCGCVGSVFEARHQLSSEYRLLVYILTPSKDFFVLHNLVSSVGDEELGQGRSQSSVRLLLVSARVRGSAKARASRTVAARATCFRHEAVLAAQQRVHGRLFDDET